jgi:hypothetical protein
MTLSIAVICEDYPDRQTACCLADRVILDQFGDHRHDGWIAEEQLDAFRGYRGLEPGQEFIVWARIATLAQEHPIKLIRGKFSGEFPMHGDEFNIRCAVQLLLFHASHPPDGIIFLRDTDNDVEKRKGLEAAREAVPRSTQIPVVIGIADTKRECWHIAGFHPEDDQERQWLDELNQELGGDPCSRSEELTAKHDHDINSAKRVLKKLTGGDRELRCLIALSLEDLKQRGKNNGLADFLTELRQHLLPLFGAVPPN